MSQSRPTVLFVDDEINMLDMFKRMLGSEANDWDAHFCSSADEALGIALAGGVDTVVSDIRMPEKDGFDLLAAIRESGPSVRVPFIILTGGGDQALRCKALELGATDLLTKPIGRDDLLVRIRTALRMKFQADDQERTIHKLSSQVEHRTMELENARRETVWRLAKTCEFRDDETGNHIVRVACNSRFIARGLGMDEVFCDLIMQASALHDIGKIGIPDRVLLKPGPLDPEERTIVQSHTTMGYEILSGRPQAAGGLGMDPLGSLGSLETGRQFRILQLAATIAECHHERWDGLGYPNGLSGEAIPLAARIVAVADVYDALISERPYKRALSVDEAVEIIAGENGRQFEPAVVRVFLRGYREMNAETDEYIGSGSMETGFYDTLGSIS
jgi:cyclic di-GMP phosphodiesterase